MALNIKSFTDGFLRSAPLILLIYICISEFGNKFHENWETMGTKLKITGMMGKFQWRYIPIYYVNGKEIEGEPSKPSDIWQSEIINY